MEGTTISHYRVLSRLGAGGMGEVWLAEDIRLKHRVAIKILLPHLASEPQAKARFLTEATAIARLEHGSIVPLLECDERDGALFLVTPFYPGGSLRERLEALGGEDLPLEQLLDWGISVAAGLTEAHEHGILHRDIKPANLLLSEKGELRICDFGLAKLADATQITATAAIMGTVSYMSPEQVRGESVDARADVWALGALLHEMASGGRPFDRENMQAAMRAILEDDPPSMRNRREDLPEEFGWIVAKCLQKDREQRYQTASELLHDLKALRAQYLGEGELAGGIQAQRPTKPARGRRRGLTAAVVLILALVTWWGIYRIGDRSPSQPDEEVQSPAWNTPPRVVVMPFENRTGNTKYDNLKERTPEVLAQGLGTIELVDVMPWNAGVTTEGGQVSLDEMPLNTFLDAVDADIGVSGSYYLDGGVLQIETQVLDARSGELVLSMPMITADPNAPGEGLEELTQRVMGGLAMRLDNSLGEPMPRIPPRYVAYAQFAKVRDSFDNPRIPNSTSVAGLDAATAADSSFWRPQLWIPIVYTAGKQWARQDTAMIFLEEHRDRLDEYENSVLDMMIENIRGLNMAGSLSIAQELRRQYPDDLVVNYFTFNYLRGLNRPREALELYQSLHLDEALRRRIIIASLTRSAAGAAHDIGDHALELKLHREKNALFPYVLFYLDEMYPFAATGQVDSMKAIIDRAATMPGGRGFHDWSVWTAANALRGHGFGEEATGFINAYLDQRLERKEDEESSHLNNNLAMLLYTAERWDEARQMFEDNIEFDRVSEGQKDVARLYLGFLAASRGEEELARQFMAEELDGWDDPYNQDGPYMWRARFEALLGQKRTAVLLLREAAAHGGMLGHGLVHGHELQSLIGYEPFDELTRPQG